MFADTSRRGSAARVSHTLALSKCRHRIQQLTAVVVAILGAFLSQTARAQNFYIAEDTCGGGNGQVLAVTSGGDLSAAPRFATGLGDTMAVCTRPGGQILASEYSTDRIVDITGGGDFSAATPFATNIGRPLAFICSEDQVLVAASMWGAVVDVSTGGDFAGTTDFFAENLGGFPIGMQVINGRIYVVLIDGKILDITEGGDFTGATPFASIPGGSLRDVEAFDGKILVSGSASGGLATVWDVTDGGSSPTVFATFPSGSFAQGLAISDGKLWTVTGAGNLYDISAGGEFNPADAFATGIEGTSCFQGISKVPFTLVVDTDGDGDPDETDPDDDNDGVPDGDDPDATDPDTCGLDADLDGCDDCGGGDGLGAASDNDPSDDGTDSDGDGLCDRVLTATLADALQTDSDGDSLFGPGDTIRYTATITNAADGLGADYTGVGLTVPAIANGTLVVGSVTTSQGTVTSGNTGGDASIVVDVGTVADGATVTISFDVAVDSPLASGITELSAQGTLASTELGDRGTDDPAGADGGAGDGPTNTPLVAPAVSATLTDTLLVDDRLPGATDGDTLRYTAAITNGGSAPATAVTLAVASLDSLATLVDGSVTTSQGSVTTGNTGGDTAVVVDVGAIASGATVTITFDAVIGESIPTEGAIVTARAEITGDNFVALLSDDPDAAGNDDSTATDVALNCPDGDDDGDQICNGSDACFGDNGTGDTDGDGLCNDEDVDDDNDGVLDGDDNNPVVATVCGDVDGDSCDDCAVLGTTADDGVNADPSMDGLDADMDGRCDATDLCTGDDATGDDDGDGLCNDRDAQPLSSTRSFAGPAHGCEHGGVELTLGFDQDGDGELDVPDEVSSQGYLCHGADGREAAFATEELDAGDATCPAGGTRLLLGIDDNDDGDLDTDAPSEVDEVVHACHGLGVDFRLTPLAVGDDSCPAGGAAIELFIDEDGDGELEQGEKSAEQALCNGLGSLVTVEPVVSDDACPQGGVRVTAGLDENGDGSLGGDEADSSQRICHGADALVVTETLPEDPDGCPQGGVRVVAGLDENGDGGLDGDETASSQGICHGANALVETEALPEDSEACPEGGFAVSAGTDEDGDGQLDEEERSAHHDVCHAVGTLVEVATLSPDPDGCRSGGLRVDTGRDADSDESLAEDEVETSERLCHGLGFLVVTERLESGDDECPSGGLRLSTGRDLDADGDLDDDEVEGDETLCEPTGSLVDVERIGEGDDECPLGGLRVNIGLDRGAGDAGVDDGELQDGEIETSRRICIEPASVVLSGGGEAECAVRPGRTGGPGTTVWALGLAAGLYLLRRRRRC